MAVPREDAVVVFNRILAGDLNDDAGAGDAMQLMRQERRVAPDVALAEILRVRGRGGGVDRRQFEDAVKDVPRLVLVPVKVHRELLPRLEAEKFPTVGLCRGKNLLVAPALFDAHLR